MRTLLVSTAVGPLGTARTGGVDRTIRNVAAALRARRHRVTVVAPLGSSPVEEADELVEVAGALQVPAQRGEPQRIDPVAPGSALEAMWEAALERQHETDVIVNFSYDWLPLYLDLCGDPETPVAHHLTMGRQSDLVARLARRLDAERPGCVATYTAAQAADHSLAAATVLGFGLDLGRYPCSDRRHARRLVWAGRIAPEKQLSHAVAAAERSGAPLDVCGAVEDAGELASALVTFPRARVAVHGDVDSATLAGVLARSLALVMTPRWEEALGIVALEALACGTPVVAYARGGIAEVVDDGVTGRLVPPDDVDALSAALATVGALDRRDCRRAAERRFSLEAYGARLEAWLTALTGGRHP